ncbi:enoyl-CoA delta isomerase 1, mitochondrial isoform X2 [Parasteatoda tepidariorum]|nr:enoyl-CoA delta isomerase 1, mitochondrial isoform X2 [Parasteatoda tepidariorum]
MQKLPVNSLSLEFMEELRLTIKELEEREFRGVIITSSAPTVFSAGLDLTELFHPEESRLRSFWRALQELWKTIYVSPLITIAAVNGHAPAGGCLLSLSCDYSIMVKAENAKIGLPATRIGIFAPKWFASMYINALGFRRAEHGVKLGLVFSPEEALRYNIVDELVDSVADLLPKAEQEMDDWLKIPKSAWYKAKLNFRKSEVDDLNRYQEEEIEEVVKLIYLEETQNNLAKYFENLKHKSQ